MSTTPAEKPKKWGVLGGGLLGLTLAHRLRKAGCEVEIIEAAPQLGGLASAWEVGGFTWDRHYHVTLLSDLHLREILQELDLDDDMAWVETKTGFYTGGQHYSMSNSLEFLRFPPLNLLEKFRLGLTIFYASKIRNPTPLEDVPVDQWLGKISGKSVLEKIWRPLLRAKLGENHERVSASFIWAIIDRMYAARNSGLKKEMFGYLPGGYARFLNKYSNKLLADGVTISTSTRVAEIQASGTGAPVTVQLEGGDSRSFDEVALTFPSPLAADLCPSLQDEEKAALKNIQYQGIVCASLVLKQSLGGFYVTNITDGHIPFTAVIEMSALVDTAEFEGQHLAYLPKYLDPEDAFFDKSDDEVRELFWGGLKEMHPHLKESDLVAFKVSRVRNVLALATLGYSRELPKIRTSLPGVHLVNSSQILNGTLNANETVHLANEAAEMLLTGQSTLASRA